MADWPKGLKSRLAGGVIYVVGGVGQWEAETHLSDLEGFVFVDYKSLASCLASDPKPTAILSVLFGNGFDAVDIAGELHKAGFKGQYRAVAGKLPRPELVRREVATNAPGLDFDIIDIEDLFG